MSINFLGKLGVVMEFPPLPWIVNLAKHQHRGQRNVHTELQRKRSKEPGVRMLSFFELVSGSEAPFQCFSSIYIDIDYKNKMKTLLQTVILSYRGIKDT